MSEIRAEVRAGRFEQALYLAELLELEFNDAINNGRLVVGKDGEMDIEPRRVVHAYGEVPRQS
ncbi:hypothetical protein [Ancylobacter oerskovii]|uniref:Uncharacterized protein n=1 Tax=Ancylobacter oerskovii TaxID=459519 RepID=A0ABW4YVI6_9HYPH|nr:hypothetical protein [Ancylobacter oerskovii]MBS7544320.1 hypothetical protein [Ancylobacter oerskovii]